MAVATTKSQAAIATLSCVASATCLGLGLLRPDWQEVNWIEIAIVLLWSCAAGQAVFASIWSAAGPGSYFLRATASLAWIYGLYFALYFNPGMRSWRHAVIEHGLLLFGFWLVTQALLQVFCRLVGWRVTQRSELDRKDQLPSGQYSIGQALLMCASVGFFLGGVRFCLVNGAGWMFNRLQDQYAFQYELPILAWAIVIGLAAFPALYFSVLATRHAGWRIGLVLAALFIAGLVEVCLATDFTYDKLHTIIDYVLFLFCMPAISVGWFIGLCLYLRAAGYRCG